MKEWLLWRLIPYAHGRILGWIIFGIIFAGLSFAASEAYVAAIREQEAAEVNYHNNEANLGPALEKYAAVVKKLRNYTAQGVATTGLDASMTEIKEDMLAGAYNAAADKIDQLDAALNQLYSAKVEADKLAQSPPPAPAPPPRSRTPSPPPPPPPAPVVSSRCGASYYTRNVEGYLTYVIEADIGSGCIKVVTDTTTGAGDCSDNCPVISLGSFVGANNGFAGMNGTYFCPGDYAGCTSSDGSFFWKVFNSNAGHMANANNGLAHLDPFMAIGANNQIHYFHTYREEFGGVCKTDTFCGVSTFEAKHGKLQAGLGSGPALTRNGNNILDQGKLDDKQKTVKSNRGAIGVRGNTLFLIIATGATVIDLAHVVDNMNVDHSFNVDGGGSAAMYWEGGYKRGPGRNIPNAVILVNK